MLDFKPSVEVLDDVAESIKSRGTRPELPTGIATLDNAVWGVHQKELMVIGARPSQGKTSLALQMAWNLSRTAPVIFLSLEMSRESIMERVFCNENMLSGWKLRTGNLISQALEKLDSFRGQLLTRQFEVMEYGFNIHQVEEVVNTMKPKAVFIDHLQRISKVGYSSRYEALSEYVSEIKAIAVRHDCAIVLCSQINRQGVGAENAMDFLKGTGEAEEAGDTIISCRWLGKEDSSSPLEKYQLSINKQRHGPTDSVNLKFLCQYFRFDDWTEAEEMYGKRNEENPKKEKRNYSF